jgi:hypothetical protein
MKHLYKRRFVYFPGIIVVIAILVLITMLLWNALLPELFHTPAINYWQAAGLILLARLLLGGIRGFHHHDHGAKKHFTKRWDEMKPEEREEAFRRFDQLRSEWRKRRFGFDDEKEAPEEK